MKALSLFKWRPMRITRNAAIAFVTLLLLSGAYLAALQLTGNFHTVVAGEFYRSAQPTAAQIAKDVQEYGIRTIVNLRGGRPGEDFYDSEIAESKELGITHIDFPLSASKKLTADQVRKLIAILKRAQKPILVHCKNGADRTGLASALYLLAVDGRTADVASDQLSIVYGHFSVPGFPSYPMDQTLHAYVAARAMQRIAR